MSTANPTEIGKAIRSLRERSGLTQEDLAKRLEVSQQSIAKWEAGKVLPRTKVIVALESLFRTRSGELLQLRNHSAHDVESLTRLHAGLYDGKHKTPSATDVEQPEHFAHSSEFPREMSLATGREYEAMIREQIAFHLPGSEDKWNQKIRGNTTSWQLDYLDHLHAAQFAVAGNPGALQVAMLISIPRKLWSLATLRAHLKDGRSYMLVITYPDDIDLNMPVPDKEPALKRSNESMLRAFVAEAALMDIFVFLVRTPAQAAKVLSTTAHMEHEDDEDPPFFKA